MEEAALAHKKQTTVRRLFLVVAFGAAFFAASLLLAEALPLPSLPEVGPKLGWLRGHRGEFDTLFLGSSRTYRQMVPELFDTLAAEAGEATRSFNLGVDGMRPPEDTFVLEKALAFLQKPRLVVVECNEIRVRVRAADRDTVRQVYWHDGKRQAAITRRAFFSDDQPKKWKSRFKDAWKIWPEFAEHAGYWLENTAHLGRGPELLASWIAPSAKPPMGLQDIGPRQDGFRILPGHEEFEPGALAEYEKDLARLFARSPRDDGGDSVSLAEIAEKRRIIERVGARMVLVIPPYTDALAFRPQQGGRVPLVLDLSSPQRYPEFYKVENRADSGHLNRKGAELYTREVVRLLVAEGAL